MGVDAVELAHSGRESSIRGLDHAVVVTGHQAVGVTASDAALDDQGQGAQIHLSVLQIQKDRLAGIAPRSPVVKITAIFKPTGAGPWLQYSLENCHFNI